MDECKPLVGDRAGRFQKPKNLKLTSALQGKTRVGKLLRSHRTARRPGLCACVGGVGASLTAGGVGLRRRAHLVAAVAFGHKHSQLMYDSGAFSRCVGFCSSDERQNAFGGAPDAERR